jgi:fibronectin type III domain protein
MLRPRLCRRVSTLIAVFVLLGALPAAALGPEDFTGDITAPEVRSMTLSPRTADVTLADAQFTADFRVTDNLSGVTNLALAWTYPARHYSRTAEAVLLSGDGRDGLWRAQWTIPRSAPGGRYELSVWVGDRVGNSRQFDAATLSGRGFPSGFDITDATPDTTAPQVTAVRFTPAAVDVRTGPARVDVEVDVRDAGSGTDWIFVGLAGPNGATAPYGVTTQLRSGDGRAGTWKGTGEVPQYVRQGRWSAQITVRDRTDNSRAYEPADLAPLTAGFEVTSEEDSRPPRVLEASYSPLEVNVHDEDQVVRVRLRIADDLSGVRDVVTSAHDMVFGQTSTTGYRTRSSGTARDSVFETSMTIARSSATGLRQLSLFTRDEVGNYVSWWGDDFLSIGAPPAILVYNTPLPPDLLGVDPGDASALVRWDPPVDDRGAEVTGYVVVASPGDIRVEVGAEARAAVVRGLTNGQAHTFMVLAVNRAGPSDPSRAASAVPVAGATPVIAAPPSAGTASVTTTGAGRASGYWMLRRDGAVHAFGDARRLGDAPVGGVAAVDLEPTPSRDGYWVVDAAGRVYGFGGAPVLGPAPRLAAGETVTSLSATRSGRGYWLFTSAGRVVAFGDAPHRGDMAGVRLNAPVLDSVPTPTGQGYYMVAGDGGVFTFGDARFAGSMGRARLNQPVQSLVPNPAGAGYWLVASDGGIFAFGDARFLGSMGGVKLNRPITGMVGSATGNGYLMVAEDGGIFTFGDVPFRGSLGGLPLPAPVMAAAPV